MNALESVRRVCSVVLICLCFVLVSNAAQKPIRLRNPISATPSASPAASPANGLFVIQFREALQPEWREQLRELGVNLTRYVPDDAFVAKFRNARPADISALSFVQFVSEYRAEHKVHPRLRAAQVATNQFDIALVLAPDITEGEAQQAKGQFNREPSEARLHSGRILRGSVSSAQLDALAASDNVLWIEPAPKMKLYDEIASRLVAGDGPPNQTLMQSLGYDGDGVTVAVADSGLDSGDTNFMHQDIQGRVKALFYYGAPGQLLDAADEHSHGTHCAGIIAGNGVTGEIDENGFLYGLGVAPGARSVNDSSTPRAVMRHHRVLKP